MPKSDLSDCMWNRVELRDAEGKLFFSPKLNKPLLFLVTLSGSVCWAAGFPTEITCTMTLALVLKSISCTACSVFMHSMERFMCSMKCHSKAGN